MNVISRCNLFHLAGKDAATTVMPLLSTALYLGYAKCATHVLRILRQIAIYLCR